MDHAWCHDVSRDAAVRAAEDGRTGPLPTLEEAIALAFGCDKASAQRACDEVNSWPDDVQKDCRFFLGNLLEQGVERLQALIEAWRWGKGLLAARYPAMIPKSGSASSEPDHENKGDGMADNGLRTERVVIEIEHSGPEPINLDDLGLHLRTRLGLFVGLRRINETAAIREREKAVEFWKEELRSRTAERDASRARVAFLSDLDLW